MPVQKKAWKLIECTMYIDSGFKKSMPIHDRLSQRVNQCQQEASIPEQVMKEKIIGYGRLHLAKSTHLW